MIYLNNGKFLSIDKILELDDDPSLIYGDKIFNGQIIGSLIEKIPGVLLTNGAIFGVIKKGKVIRMVSTESRYPNFKVVTSRTGKKYNSYCIVKKKKFKDNEHYAEILDIFDGIGDLEVERRYLKTVFNVDYKKIKYKIDQEDRFKDFRVTLDVKPFSIDPPNCYDIDDAIHIIQKNRFTEVGVHIADVSSFIEVESELDSILAKRGESVYLNKEQIDMLPKNLVEETSLFEKKNRRAFSVILKFNRTELIDVDFKRSIINVEKNLSYKEASKLDIIDVKSLYDFGKMLYKGDKYSIHKTIEIFMVIANQQVAKKIKQENIYKPIFRKYSKIVLDLKDDLDNDIKETIRFFNSDKAFYSLQETHEDLGEYSHFTSPIRRYIDIVNHRMLWGSLIKKDIKISPIPIEQLIENINFRGIEIKKSSRESERLEQSYMRCNSKMSLETKTGKIVRFGNNKLTVFFKDKKFTVSCKIVPEDVDHEIEYFTTYIEINIQNKKIKLFLGQDIKVNILASFSSPKLSDKLTGQIVDPDIRSFYL